ncbi:MAG: O-antigen ligase family protein [Chlamydiota bacterium]
MSVVGEHATETGAPGFLGTGKPGQKFRSREFTVRWLRRATYLALLLLVAGAPFAPHFVQFVSRVAFALWLAGVAIERRSLGRNPLLLPFLIFFGIAGLSAAVSYDPLLSWTRLGWFGLGVLILIVPDTVRSKRDLRLLIIVLLAAGSISGLRTAWQYTAGIGTELVDVRRDCPLAGDGLWSGDMIQEINGHRTRTPSQWQRALQVTRHDEKLRLHVARTYPLQHFDVVVARSHLDNWLAEPTSSVARGRPLRAQGGFYNSIPYAGLMMVLTALSCGLLLSARNPVSGFLLATLTLLLAASLWLTVTRAYIVALLIAILLMYTMYMQQTGNKLRRMPLLVILLGIVVTLGWTRTTRHLQTWYGEGEEEHARIMMWEDSPRLILRHPLLGIGWDSVFSHGRQWNLLAYRAYPKKQSHFHSTPIQVAVDSGILGLAAWIWLLAAWFRMLLGNLRLTRRGDRFSRGLALGLFGSAAGFVLASVVHYTLGDGEVMGMLWFLMGCAVVLHRQFTKQPGMTSDMGGNAASQ